MFPDRRIVDRLKQGYPNGVRVELDCMDDPHAPPVGTHGSVAAVDDIGTIHVRWDNGSSLGVAYGVDSCHIVTDEE